MVNSIRFSHSAKDEENKYGRVTQNAEKGKKQLHPDVSDATGLRRSPRETSSRRIISGPSSIRRSGQFKKGVVTRIPVDKKRSELVGKKNMPSPLRRSGRTGSYSSTSHSDSKSSGSLNSNPKPKKEKSVRQLTFEAKEVKENEEQDLGTPQVEVRRMNARMYRSFFELPKEVPERMDKSNEGGKNIPDKIDQGFEGCHSDREVSKNGALPSKDGKLKEMRVSSRLSGPVKDLVENTVTLDSMAPSNAATYEAGLTSERILDEDLIRNTVRDDRGKKAIPSESKEITGGVNTDVSATLAKGDNSNVISDSGGLSRISGKIMETDGPSNATVFETGLVSERVQPDRCREEAFPSSNSKNGVQLPEDGKSKEMRVDHGLSDPMKDLVENTMSLGSSAPSDAATFEIGLVPKSIQPEDLIGNSVGYDSSVDKLVPSKTKRIMVDMDSDVSATLAEGNNCNSVPNCSSPSVLGGNIMGTDGSHSKRIRLDDNPIGSESCNPSTTELEDGDSIAASMLQGSKINNEKEAGLITNSINSVTQLKEKLSSHNPYRGKSDSVRFVEYWVPVQISNLQLEQYCSILLSNASILRSSSKVDSIEAVRDVLILTRKCCSHPYLVGPELQPSLNKGLEPSQYLDFDLKASGKLQLLDSMLEELRKSDLRVLILFQYIGSSGRVIGNYLEDLLRQRFGPDSYERIDKNILPSKRQAAMKKFNDKNNKRFVFLLETCACLPSIKLSSVDSIIIFDSDWNPMNDIRSLQKITLDSQFDFIKIFRLYSTFTVEEKALILAKQCKSVDFSLQNMNWSTSHMLLMWGASCLFDELKAFHDGETYASNAKSLFGRPFLKEAMDEFSSLLSQDGEHIDSSNSSILLKVQQNGATYHGNFSLHGELKLGSLDEEPSQFFWTKLLDGKQFQWKYLNNSSQRSRKKVHHFEGSVNGPDNVTEGAAKKRRKVNIVDPPSSKFEDEKLPAGSKADRSQGDNVESERKSGLHDEQSSLHILLKPEIIKLCDFLLLPDKVKSMIEKFLEYVINNHDVNREPFSILQAFQLSLCWTAASLLKHKLDPIAYLIKELNFGCKKEEVDYIYSMLRCLKKIFLYRTGSYNDTDSPKASEPSDGICTRVEQEVELFKKDMSKSIKEIQKKCKKKLKKLCLLQDEEKQKLKEDIEEEEAKFEEWYKLQSAVIRSCSPNDVIRMEKLRVLNIEYEKGIEERKCQHETQLKDLEAKQSADKQKFLEKEAAWVEDVESWAQNELLKIVASKERGTGVESFQTYGQVQPDNGLKNHFAEGKGHDDKVKAITETVAENSPLSDERIANRAAVSLLGRKELLRQQGIINTTDSPENDGAVNLPSSMEQESDGGAVNEVSYRELRLSNGPDNNTHSSPWHENSGDSSSILNGHIPVDEQETRNELDTVCIFVDVPPETSGMVITECPQDASPLNPPSSMTQMSDKGRLEVPCLDRVLSPRTCQAACSGDEGPNNMSISNPLLEQQTTDVPLSIPAAADCVDDIERLTSAVLVAKRTTSEEQEGAPKTMAELSQEPPVSRTFNVTDLQEQVGQLSIGSTHDHEKFKELQHSSEQPELVPSTVDVVPAGQSNQASLIVKPVNQVQQLLSAELPSSHLNNFCLATEVEHQPTVAPNQDVQSDSNLEHSHGHPASDSDPNTVAPSEVIMQSANAINSSIPLEINYQHLEAEIHSASRKLHLSYYDPLKIELDRIRKVADQTMKIYEKKNMELKSEFEKELEELRRKYDIKIQGIETEFKQRKTTLDTSLNVVRMNKFLADAFRSKCSNLKPSCTSGTLQDSSFSAQQLPPPSRQQNSNWPSLVAGSSSCGPSPTNRQSPSTNPTSQLTLHPIRAGYSASRFPPNVSARSPIINTISLPVGNLQPGGEIRAPAPHLQPFRP
ncbi:helicase protein MOM1 isoform X2 [Vigna unguiculata]|uniref:helicase protein MOM1 isoform X2 n=1 Tax=Vigna unguiculata TaxID=3917 RepID=UPI0010168622|nr:helicase protein MOM1 isoform X2 [Vigna unguiculata]